MLHLTDAVNSVVRELGEEKRERYWLGVDGGGTHTRAMIFRSSVDDAGKNLVGEGNAEAANFHRVGIETATKSVKTAIEEACAQAGITPGMITAACIGLAGVSHPDNHRKMFEAISVALPSLPFTLETDARIALAGATAGKPGVVIIAGTGSIAFGINRSGVVARAGGWGPTLGDEGSGTYIGRRALEAVMTAYDRRTPEETLLTGRICSFFKVQSPAELPSVVYQPNSNVMPQIAQISRIVVDTAQEGDRVAIEILAESARQLAKAVKAVIEQLRMKDDAFNVGYVGGVFGAGPLILGPLADEINSLAPKAVLAPPMLKPAVGAAKMAADQHQRRVEALHGAQHIQNDQELTLA